MTTGRAWLALVALVALPPLTGCLPVITPPVEGGGGGAARFGGEAGYRFYAGAHVASAVPDVGFPVDVGAGYVQQGTVQHGNAVPVRGVYLEGGPQVFGGRSWRAFVRPRAEYYFDPQGPDAAYGALVRFTVEAAAPAVFEPVAGSNGKGIYAGLAFGVLAIGAYLEGGYQRLPFEASLPMAGIGLYLRVPTVAGLVCCAWDLAAHGKN